MVPEAGAPVHFPMNQSAQLHLGGVHGSYSGVSSGLPGVTGTTAGTFLGGEAPALGSDAPPFGGDFDVPDTALNQILTHSKKKANLIIESLCLACKKKEIKN